MSGGGIERRAAVQRLALGALLPLAALGTPLSRLAAGRRAIEIPSGAFRLERVLTRGLGDGAAIVVTRHWRIAFAPSAGGITVSGVQTFADIAAPPVLAPLAAIERARSASDLFPLAIDEAGLIRGGGSSGDGAALIRALETGRALVDALSLPQSERLDANGFLAHLSTLSASAVSRLPRDLFFPEPGNDSTAREIALPGGETGSVAIVSQVSAMPGTGLLASSERRIVTRVAASQRLASERWILVQA